MSDDAEKWHLRVIVCKKGTSYNFSAYLDAYTKEEMCAYLNTEKAHNVILHTLNMLSERAKEN